MDAYKTVQQLSCQHSVFKVKTSNRNHKCYLGKIKLPFRTFTLASPHFYTLHINKIGS